MTLLDGKTLSDSILNNLKSEVSKLSSPPQLDIVLVGDDAASVQYVTMKQKKAEYVGIKTNLHRFPQNSTTDQIAGYIYQLNTNVKVTAIMVQLPLPPAVDTFSVVDSISPDKDVDGLSAASLGLLFHQNPKAITPATPLGVMTLLDHYKIPLESKDVVIIGRSPYIGIPLAALMLQKNATVTVCHSHTLNLSAATCQADILISAAGKPGLITVGMVKDNAIVVDIGLSPDPATGKLVGDIDSTVGPKCSYLTPVPGGVGPMTIASLLSNVVNISKKTYA